MALSDKADLNPSTALSGSALKISQSTSHPKSLAAAQSLLTSLRPHINAILNSKWDGEDRKEIDAESGRSRTLKLKLNRMDIMKPERPRHRLLRDQETEGECIYGRVLWVGPDTKNINVGGDADADGDTRRLYEVCSTPIPFSMLCH